MRLALEPKVPQFLRRAAHRTWRGCSRLERSWNFVLLFLLSTTALADNTFHIYAPSRDSGTLMIVEAKPDGDKLTLTKKQQPDLGFLGSSIVAHPEKPLLYIAAVRVDDDNIVHGAAVRLNDDGTYASHDSVKLNHPAAYLSLDRENRFLLSCHYFGGNIEIYELDENGVPGTTAFSLDEGRQFAHCILPSPDNQFIYIPYVKENNALYQYRFDAKLGHMKALEPKNVGPPEGTGPRHMAYHPEKPFVYFSNEQHLGVSVYEQAADGTLSIRQVCDAVGEDQSKDGVSSSDILITPDGRFLFAGIRGHRQDFDRISRYRVEDDGTVELLGLTPADKIPWGLTLSPDGKYLIASAFQGATLTAYRIGEDGDLTKAASIACDKQITDLVTR
ncbi:MAG: beta-propeller fold lactonase family protein [Verrucomicrobiota bacterium]